MLKRLSQFMSKIHSPYLMYLLFVVAGGFFWLFNFSDLPLPISNPQLVKIGGGAGLLDLKLFYTAQEAYAMLTQYGEEGRALYKRFLTVDFIFAFCYGLGFSMLFTRLVSAMNASETFWMTLNLLPLAIALADYSENIAIYLMLNVYPENVPVIGMLAGVSTLSKHVLTFITLSCLLVVTVVCLFSKPNWSETCFLQNPRCYCVSKDWQSLF